MKLRTILLLLTLLAAAPAAQAQRPLCIVNGRPYDGDALREIPSSEIERIEELPADERTVARYGPRANNGVVLVTLRYDTPARFAADTLSFAEYIARQVRWDDSDPVARVVYRFEVDTAGRVVLGDLLESTDGRLRRKVERAVEQAPRWEPASREGRPVATQHVLRLQLPEGRTYRERAVLLY